MRMLLLVIALFLAIVGQPSSAAPLAQANLDPAAFAVSVGGRETTANLPIDGPSTVIWTDKTTRAPSNLATKMCPVRDRCASDSNPR